MHQQIYAKKDTHKGLQNSTYYSTKYASISVLVNNTWPHVLDFCTNNAMICDVR